MFQSKRFLHQHLGHDHDNRLKQFNNEYAKISKEYEKDSKENNSANKTEKTGIDNLLLKVSKACEALRGFQSPQGDIRLHAICLSGESGRIDNCHDLDDSGVLSSFNEAWSYAKLTSQYVIRFAKQLNAARTLRDAAIIYHSLETLKETPDNRSEDIAEIADWAYSICNGAPSISISFCSKFLHFHFPQLFFIYDSISSERAKAGNLSKGPFDFALKKNVKKGEDNVGQPSRVIREWIKENPKSDSKNNDESTKSNKKYDDKLMLYQEHVFNELVISYAIFRYLLDASDKDSEERRKAKEGLWEHLKDYTSSQDTCREIPCGPPHCLSITRLVDELVTNSSPENLEEAKETD